MAVARNDTRGHHAALVKVPGYEIQQLLSWGAQGDVFLALAADGRRVALKIVTNDRTDGDPQARQRLAREARLLAAIDSPHVVKVHGFVQDSEWSCLVLDYLDGQRLDAAVRTRAGLAPPASSGPDEATKVLPKGSLPATRPVTPAALCTPAHVAWALDLALQLASGAAELHTIRLVHRDLKPQNAIVVDGRLVLFDFGFARLDGVTTLTQDGTAIGTLAYMAPELLRGAAASERTDVHGLGATLHFCLTGAPPLPEGPLLLSAMSARTRPSDVRRDNPAVDASFAAVVARCLEPDPRDRYADAREVLADLQRCATGARVRPPFSAGRVWRHHRRPALAAAATAALVLTGAALLREDDPTTTATTTILYHAATDPAAALAAWRAGDDGQRAAVLDALNQRLGADTGLALAVAHTLQLGLLRLQPRPDHLVALVASDGQDAAPALPPAAFLPVDRERNLLVEPGHAWFFVRSTAANSAWRQDDPRCLQLLLQLGPVDGAVPARSLAALPTNGAQGPFRSPAWIEFPVGDYPLRNPDNVPITQRNDIPFVVGATEVSVEMLTRFRAQIGPLRAQRVELDAWLRHPAEPAQIADKLWSMWAEARGGIGDTRPAQLTFWEAHRFAAWSGCRLPTVAEWLVINTRNDGTVPGDMAAWVVKPLVPVDTPPAWDRTDRGVCFANSNVREWTLARGDVRGEMYFLAVPGVFRQGGVNIHLPQGPNGNVPDAPEVDPRDPNGRPGLRLYRTRLHGR